MGNDVGKIVGGAALGALGAVATVATGGLAAPIAVAAVAGAVAGGAATAATGSVGIQVGIPIGGPPNAGPTAPSSSPDPVGPAPPAAAPSPAVPVAAPQTVPATPTTEAAMRSFLADRGVNVWESQPGRTAVLGLRPDTVDAVLHIQSRVHEPITITGAAESAGAHASGPFSHANGYKVDMRVTPALTSYIESTLTSTTPRTGPHGGPRWTGTINGRQVEVVREPNNHYDMVVR